MASCSDAITVSLVDATMSSWQHILQDPELRDRLLWQEHAYDPPVFDSRRTYDATIKKCNTVDNIRWMIGALLDLVTHHGTNSSEFSARPLSGKKASGGNGQIELMVAKQRFGQSMALSCCEHALQ